ncbi:hypothetical protein AMAG_20600 [Allomyces macrogynus ATCC 38327]|uniref:Uncharacterized protein n=1 Tax=Allomyces macrogynus (strain ATCC 38327) TaxID=578462 RepID=A0A0L0TCZ1_ALLM3|nr:hypothetical protein AMAG_20600 [Allomyces macrogynus ATCC 38327]|eukprot:KNE72540.1 hypothetical protein AMAG_20600 [Allomyces macrogynus ATCC 38327]
MTIPGQSRLKAAQKLSYKRGTAAVIADDTGETSLWTGVATTRVAITRDGAKVVAAEVVKGEQTGPCAEWMVKEADGKGAA